MNITSFIRYIQLLIKTRNLQWVPVKVRVREIGHRHTAHTTKR
jgi:hypothetical protein